MSSLADRQLLGLGLMSVASGVALWIGDLPVRLMAILVVGCWPLAALVQVVTGMNAEPVIATELVFGIMLLILAASFGEAWLWVEVALQAVLLALQAWLYTWNEAPAAAEVIGNDLLLTAILGTLIAAAVRAHGQRRAAEDWSRGRRSRAEPG